MATIVETSTMEMRVYNIPDDLHQQFKLVCVQEKITMNAMFIKAMQAIVEKHRKGK